MMTCTIYILHYQSHVSLLLDCCHGAHLSDWGLCMMFSSRSFVPKSSRALWLCLLGILDLFVFLSCVQFEFLQVLLAHLTDYLQLDSLLLLHLLDDFQLLFLGSCFLLSEVGLVLELASLSREQSFTVMQDYVLRKDTFSSPHPLALTLAALLLDGFLRESAPQSVVEEQSLELYMFSIHYQIQDRSYSDSSLLALLWEMSLVCLKTGPPRFFLLSGLVFPAC